MVDESQLAGAIGVDVGGTKCAAGLVLLADGRVMARRVKPTRPERGGRAVLEDVIGLIESLREEADRLAVRPASIGIGVCELVSCEGQVLSEATVRWKDERLAEQLAATGLPVHVDADVRAAARAEARFGAGRGLSSFVYVTVGTGISACLVINNEPYAGARGLTGTFASSDGLIPGSDGQLHTGPPLESFSSGPALAARLAATRKDFCGAAPDVIRLAENGDPLAQHVVVSAGSALGAAIGNLVNILDPEAVVIGGGLGLATGLYRKAVKGAMCASVWSAYHRDIKLLPAQLGIDAGLIGAASLGFASLDRT
jgi:glucokinase